MNGTAKQPSPRNDGFALAGAIMLLFVMGIIGTSFLVMASREAGSAHQDLKSQRAFWLAEGGKERALKAMRDRYRPPSTDETIYSSVSDPDGGSYTVRVLVDTTALFDEEKAFMLECVGEWQGRRRRIRQRITMTSFASYAYFTDDELTENGGKIWFIGADVIEGKIHSNGTFHIKGNPSFLGRLTSASDHMVAYPGTYVYDEEGWPAGGNNPYFAEGMELDVASIPLPTNTNDLRQAALAGGVHTDPATTVELGVDKNGAPSPGMFRYRPSAGGPWDDADIALLQAPVFYSENDVRVSGIIDGEITIASRRDIYVVEDLTYLGSDGAGAPQPGCDDLCGLVAEDDILFWDDPATDDLKVNAVLMALDTSIKAEDYSNGRIRGKLTIWGGLIQERRGAVGTFNGATGQITSGYEKDYHYDTRVTGRTPPEFPLTGVYNEVAWNETWDDSDPF